jgi:hypothetical protein
MFWKKKAKPSHIVDVTIKVNLRGIENYLKINREGVYPRPVSQLDWHSSVIQQHRIFVMPPSDEQSEYYFHKSINKPSRCFVGVQSLSATGTPKVKRYCDVHQVDGELEWDIWNEYLTVAIDRKLIAFVPLAEIVSIQQTGRTSSINPAPRSDRQVVESPVQGDGKGPFFSMLRTIDSEGVMYSNEFALIVFEAASKLNNYDYELKN